MKAAVLYEIRQPMRIEELEMPEVGDDDVLIKVVACGVCHTDLKVIEGKNPFTAPTVLGHEVAHATAEHVAERIERQHLTEVAATLIHSADERIPVSDLELGVRWLRHAARAVLA